MMGRREQGQGQFFYAFDLDKVVPPDHLVRQIDGVLDLDWVHKELAPYYSHTGRPSIDPMLMIRMLIVGYVFAIRSERRLCSEVQVNLAYRWFCQLGIEDRIPDHSVFSRARHERFRQSDALRRIFESVVAKCIAAGLVGGEGFSIDASLIRADVDKKKRTPGDQPVSWPKAEEASRAVREYLTALDAAQNHAESSEDDDKFNGGRVSPQAANEKPPFAGTVSAHAAVGRNDPDKAGNTANVESRARRSTPQEAVSCFIVGAFQGELCCMIGGQLDPSQSALCWSIYCDLVGKSLRRAKADPMSKS